MKIIKVTILTITMIFAVLMSACGVAQADFKELITLPERTQQVYIWHSELVEINKSGGVSMTEFTYTLPTDPVPVDQWEVFQPEEQHFAWLIPSKQMATTMLSTPTAEAAFTPAETPGHINVPMPTMATEFVQMSPSPDPALVAQAYTSPTALVGPAGSPTVSGPEVIAANEEDVTVMPDGDDSNVGNYIKPPAPETNRFWNENAGKVQQLTILTDLGTSFRVDAFNFDHLPVEEQIRLAVWLSKTTKADDRRLIYFFGGGFVPRGAWEISCNFSNTTCISADPNSGSYNLFKLEMVGAVFPDPDQQSFSANFGFAFQNLITEGAEKGDLAVAIAPYH